MPRQNFITAIPSIVKGSDINGGNVAGPFSVPDGRYAAETSSGTHRRKPSGWIPPTGYSYSHVTFSRDSGECKYWFTSNPNTNNRWITGCVGGVNGVFNSLNRWDELVNEGSIVDAALANTALIAARGKLKGQSVNLAVAFGERRQTAQLIGDTAKRLVETVRSLKRGNIRDAMNKLGLSHNSRQPRGSNWPRHWLELQYGWKPLLSDVYGACDALSKRNKSDWRVTVTATRSSKRDYSRSWGGNGGGVGSAKVSCSAFVRIDALPQNEANISLASLGISNPATLGWELLPFSFVVDWLLPVGGWIDSLDAMLGYGEAYTSTSVLTRASWDTRGTGSSSGGFTYQNNYVGSKRVVKLERTASAGVPLPSFPSLKDPRSLGHMANGLALLSQVFGR